MSKAYCIHTSKYAQKSYVFGNHIPASPGCNVFSIDITCMYYTYKPSERNPLIYGENYMKIRCVV